MNKLALENTTVCIVGLGYVGLPLVEAFSSKLRVIGYDIDKEKVKQFNSDNSNRNITFTENSMEISKARFIIICVPTPVTNSKEPDLSYVKDAARKTGQNMRKDSVVILESTVYPGVTEDVMKPILEKESGFSCGVDFKVAYSPERINPGDKEHELNKVTKVIAGIDAETTELVAELYRTITPHIFVAKNIKTAEAAKVIENIQRDLNIALINEFTLIFEKMGLSSRDVLSAAATKWNFHDYSPGLVGGHCIPVDPYYLVYKSQELGYHPQVILAGRAINDNMPLHVAQMAIKALNDVGKVARGAKALIAGLTYKEDVVDIRETPVRGIIKGLQEYGVEVFGFDPLLDDAEEEFGIKIISRLEEVQVDVIILTVAHQELKRITIDRFKGIMNESPVLIDVRGIFDGEEMNDKGFHYRTL